jgi:hypothetical protein
MEAGLCNRCRGFDAEDLPVACTVLEGSPCSACKEGGDILGQIKRLEEEIIKLKEKHHALRATINSIHDPFIHKFPPEIGSYIFRLCLPTLDFGELSPLHKRKEVTGALRLGALRLGAVSRKWRQLAWTTPNLWEMLYLYIGPSTTNSLAKSLPGLVESWLGRSGVLPLAIFFVNDYSERSEIEFAIPRIIEVINLHSSRWRTLLLNVVADIPEAFFWFHASQSTCSPSAGNQPPETAHSKIRHEIQALPYTFRTWEFSTDIDRYQLGQPHTCKSPQSDH